jgi:hypothetical protein
MFSFGLFLGVCNLNANVSERSVCSIFRQFLHIRGSPGAGGHVAVTINICVVPTNMCGSSGRELLCVAAQLYSSELITRFLENLYALALHFPFHRLLQ